MRTETKRLLLSNTQITSDRTSKVRQERAGAKGSAWEKNQYQTKKRVLNSLKVPKNLQREPFGIFKHPFYCRISKNIQRGPFAVIENFREKNLTKPKMEGGISEYQKDGKGALLPWNGFVFYVRGFGCVQSQVLSNYGKSAKSAQKRTIQSEADKKF